MHLSVGLSSPGRRLNNDQIHSQVLDPRVKFWMRVTVINRSPHNRTITCHGGIFKLNVMECRKLKALQRHFYWRMVIDEIFHRRFICSKCLFYIFNGIYDAHLICKFLCKHPSVVGLESSPRLLYLITATFRYNSQTSWMSSSFFLYSSWVRKKPKRNGYSLASSMEFDRDIAAKSGFLRTGLITNIAERH